MNNGLLIDNLCLAFTMTFLQVTGFIGVISRFNISFSSFLFVRFLSNSCLIWDALAWLFGCQCVCIYILYSVFIVVITCTKL